MIYILAGVVAALIWLFIIVIAAKDYHPDLPRYKVKKINPRERDVTDKIFDDTNPPRFKRNRVTIIKEEQIDIPDPTNMFDDGIPRHIK